MDGFAVIASDIATASAQSPRGLNVIGEIAAGAAPTITVERGTAVRILTGAPLPAGADAVVPVEDTNAPPGVADLPDNVMILTSFEAGAHIRRAGSDLRTGQRLLSAGATMTASAIGLAAAGGYGSISAYRRPRVAILATGDELVPAGDPIGPAQIPESNSPALCAAALESGAEVRSLGIARDSLESVTTRLAEGFAWADIVVASGGVSVGAHDVVKDAFGAFGRLELWRIAVQPGKPLAFGRAPGKPDGGDVLFFGLPGNPVSSLVTFELFVRPVIRRLAGHADVIGREVVRATLTEPVRKGRNRRAFLRVNLQHDGDAWRVRLSGGQESHMLSVMATADALAVIPESVDELPAGAEVEVIRLR
jgi:molybdopterin molybdotransferase